MNEKQVRWDECAASTAVATLPFPSSSCKPVAAVGTGMGPGITCDEPVMPAPADASGPAAGDTIALRPQGDDNLSSPHAGAAMRVISTEGYVIGIPDPWPVTLRPRTPGDASDDQC
jgi:hypothetical protein